jgi:hypothetical protein
MMRELPLHSEIATDQRVEKLEGDNGGYRYDIDPVEWEILSNKSTENKNLEKTDIR